MIGLAQVKYKVNRVLTLFVFTNLETCLYLINMRGFSRSHCIFFRGYFTHTHRRFKMTLNADVMAYLHLK